MHLWLSKVSDTERKRYITHWGRVTHICVGNLTIIGPDNGLSPGRCQAIIWTNAGMLLIGPWGTNFSEILIGIQTFSFKKMHLKMSSAKWRPFCLGLNVLNTVIPHWLRTCSCLYRNWALFYFKMFAVFMEILKIVDCSHCRHFSIRHECRQVNTSTIVSIFGPALTSRQGHTFCVSGILLEKPTSHQWFPITKGQYYRALVFSLLTAGTNCWASSQIAGDFRFHNAHVTSLAVQISTLTFHCIELNMWPMWVTVKTYEVVIYVRFGNFSGGVYCKQNSRPV